ncbi:MAG: hypothetical protein ACRDM7_12940 [Thermoleophilaceae bacterium]
MTGRSTRTLGSVAVILGAAFAGSGCGAAAKDSTPAAAPRSAQAADVCGTYSGRGCAPRARRVDLVEPSFSNPTQVTNPLFPIAKLRSAILLGNVEGVPLRVETTLLPGAKTIDLGGREVKALASQYVAFLGGRIEEVALDWYAQADDGSVWYLGEDVFNYAHGTIEDTEGTWLAGREGPAAMIMPGQPRVGDVFRPENVPGIIFEEVSVKATGRTVTGPRGRLEGGIVTDELHLDGTHEDKTFAPGYGEFSTGSKGDLEALALAVPTDALPGPPPAAVERLGASAIGILGSARAEDWKASSATLRRMKADWHGLRTGQVPPMLRAQMDRALERLGRAVRARRPLRAALAAIDTAQAGLDLELRHRPVPAVDLDRFDLWASRVLVHAAAGDREGVTGDVATLEWIRDRIAHVLDPAGLRELDARLRDLRGVADLGNVRSAADHAARLAARLRELAPPQGHLR